MGEQEKQKGNAPVDMKHILKARYDKLAEYQADKEDPFEITKAEQTHHSTEIKENFKSLENQQVVIAGRILSKRVMGKASFMHLQDRDGRIQVYVSRESLGEEEYKKFKKLDLGDIVEVRGYVFETQMGEISVHGEKSTLLFKSLYPLRSFGKSVTSLPEEISWRWRLLCWWKMPAVQQLAPSKPITMP